jgi:hypothetical protein
VNDPRALGAARLAFERSTYVIDLGRLSAPTLLYCGSRDAADPEFAAVLRETANALGVEPRILESDHDHFGAFDDAAATLPLAMPHLEKNVA